MAVAEFFNHNSFWISLLLIGGLAFGLVWRLVPARRRARTLVWIALGLIAVYVSFSPRVSSGEAVAEIEARIGQGIPVLLEFKSPN